MDITQAAPDDGRLPLFSIAYAPPNKINCFIQFYKFNPLFLHVIQAKGFVLTLFYKHTFLVCRYEMCMVIFQDGTLPMRMVFHVWVIIKAPHQGLSMRAPKQASASLLTVHWINPQTHSHSLSLEI